MREDVATRIWLLEALLNERDGRRWFELLRAVVVGIGLTFRGNRRLLALLSPFVPPLVLSLSLRLQVFEQFRIRFVEGASRLTPVCAVQPGSVWMKPDQLPVEVVIPQELWVKV